MIGFTRRTFSPHLWEVSNYVKQTNTKKDKFLNVFLTCGCESSFKQHLKMVFKPGNVHIIFPACPFIMVLMIVVRSKRFPTSLPVSTEISLLFFWPSLIVTPGTWTFMYCVQCTAHTNLISIFHHHKKGSWGFVSLAVHMPSGLHGTCLCTLA